MNNRIQYRRDIDGLRALAVLSVIFFHINPKWISGGFLGVDMFFVISGYLITLILTKEIVQTQKVNIINFYKRRIKRIIPALLFMLIPTLIVALLLFTPDKLLELSTSMVYSFFSVANIYFFTSIDTGYFATGSNEIPLLHLWSLGVEEQFYILWPFLLLFLLRYLTSIKLKVSFILTLFLSSLAFAHLYIEIDHSFTYYMIFTRAWELLAGSAVALLVHSEFRLKRGASELLALLSLTVIILSLIFVTENDAVPGLASLPIIIATSLLIFSGSSHHSFVAKLLSLRLFVLIGLVSYSAYLWHWPILAFLHYALVEIDAKVTFFILLSTFILATISYRFIESPLRKNQLSTAKVYVFYLILPAFLLSLTSIFITKSIEKKKEFIFPWSQLQSLKRDTLAAYAYNYNCQYSLFNINAYTQERCIYPNEVKKADAFLIGDSNAAHYLGMLRVFSDTYNFSIRNATQSSCPMVLNNNFDWISSTFKKGCSIYTHSLINEIKNYDTIIVGGAWDSYYHKKDFQTSFRQTVNELAVTVNNIILLGQVPYFGSYSKECEIRSIRLKNLECKKRSNYKTGEIKSNTFLKKLADQYSNVHYFDITDQICKDGHCSPYIGQTAVYYNTNHLSMKGSELIGREMIKTKNPMLDIFHNINSSQIINRTKITTKEENDIINFIVSPRFKNVNIAFYLYKDGKRIHTQWYSKKFSYKLDKKKNAKGEYRVRYFIVNDKIKNPGKEKKIEQGFSEYIKIN